MPYTPKGNLPGGTLQTKGLPPNQREHILCDF